MTQLKGYVYCQWCRHYIRRRHYQAHVKAYNHSLRS